MSNSTQAVHIAEEAWPALPSERNWGAMSLFFVAVSAAVATWCFQIGGFVAYYLPAGSGTIAMIAGSLIGCLLIFLAGVPVCTRYGIDTITSVKPQLGTRGAYLGLFFMYASVIGWNCMLLIMLGKAVAAILISIGWADSSQQGLLMRVFGLVGVLATFWSLRKGPDSVRDTSRVVALGVTILSIYILWLLIHKIGLSTIFSAQPSAPAPSKLWNYTTGVEILVASVLSWWPYTGGMVKMVPSARKTLWPVIVGLCLPVSLVSLIGFYTALAMPDTAGDPTVFLVQLGGALGAIPALLFIILANVGTAVVGVYVSAIGLRQIPLVQRRTGWNGTTAMALIPVAVIVVLFPDLFFEHTGTFLAFVGLLFAPLCGIQIVDYFLLRKQKLDAAALYISQPGAPYFFLKGFNPAGILGLLAGFATYLYLLNPITYVSAPLYEYLSASLPSAVAAGLIYALVTRWVNRPLGLGGY